MLPDNIHYRIPLHSVYQAGFTVWNQQRASSRSSMFPMIQFAAYILNRETVSTIRSAYELSDIFKELSMAEEKGLSDEKRKELEDKAATKGLQALFKVRGQTGCAASVAKPDCSCTGSKARSRHGHPRSMRSDHLRPQTRQGSCHEASSCSNHPRWSISKCKEGRITRPYARVHQAR